jgi:hypothetical protein
MIQFLLQEFVCRWERIQADENACAKAAIGPSGTNLLVPEDFQQIEKTTQDIRWICEHLKLDESLILLREFDGITKNKPCSYQTINALLESCANSIRREVGWIRFALIPKDKIHFFDQELDKPFFGNEPVFGEKIDNAFPAARIDIKNAGTCLALNLNDATIFHLMRVVEVGLRDLAKKLKVKVPKTPIEYATWEKVLEHMEIEISKMKQLSKGKKKSEALAFYRGCMGEFHGFKDVWRNNIMHTRKNFNEHDAMSAFIRVRAFMQRLAENL